jgi:selenocysteine lyase/cysteine desulfurase
MRPAPREDHIDFLAFSAHKMYAPFGTGVLVGPRALFDEGEPDHVGGGTVDLVTTKRAYWTEPPEKEEAGTPNVIGALALARAIAVLEQVGMDAIAEHERRLTAYALRKLREIDGLRLYGDTDPALPRDRVGVIPFNVRDYDCALTSAVMAHEGGIGVRHGCFCAHPFISFLLHIDEGRAGELASLIEVGDRTQLPGLVRISFGVYNTESEVDAVAGFLSELARRGPRAEYLQVRETGEFYPKGYAPDFAPYFKF